MNYRFAPVALALATLGTAAMAQSSVTVYGRVDLSVAQNANQVKNNQIQNGSGSRLGFKGEEDLGGGLKAVFDIQHRFNADEGTQSNATRFWDGKAIVGLAGAFGKVTLGREENPAYTYSQSAADPWGTETVASNANIVQAKGVINTSTRNSNSVNYAYATGGLKFGAQVAEAAGNVGSGAERPFSVGAAYATGPVSVGFGYERPSDKDANWITVNGAYDFGMVKLGAFVGNGKNAADQKIQSYLVSATAPIGSGALRASYGELKNKELATNQKLVKQFGLGYQYFLSKRTTAYVDVVNFDKDGGLATGFKKTGYDIGLKHNF